jgi:hypothetical protein
VITCVVEYTIDPAKIDDFERYFIAADRIRDESGCVLRYERTFMRPLLSPTSPGPAPGAAQQDAAGQGVADQERQQDRRPTSVQPSVLSR